jgi:hypothetical protein
MEAGAGPLPRRGDAMTPEIAWIEAMWAQFERDNPSQTIMDVPLARPIGEKAVSSTQEEVEYGKGEQGTLFS